MAACEGPVAETAMSLASWLENRDEGGAKNITMFTPGKVMAASAGEKVAAQLLDIAGGMGFGYKKELQDITRLTVDGIEFANGESLEAELKIIFPDWVPHAFLQGLPICDEEGFVITNLQMRNPDYPEVFAAGDAAAATVPKLGSIGHHQSYIVARQIAKDMEFLDAGEADSELYNPEVICYGDMGNGQGFYIHSNSWYGGQTQLFKKGRFYHDLKLGFKTTYFAMGGKVPHWQWKLGTWVGDKV
jgi:sulfide:quinone oxidoreductase